MGATARGLFERVAPAVFGLSRAWAVLGGVMLLAVMLMTVLSVVMRAVLGFPILGDYELVEIGTAIAAFAFLPYCHQAGGNVVVDVFTNSAPERVKRALGALGSLLLAIVACALLWRMALGGYDFFHYHEVTTNLGIPRWWAFPPILISLALLALVSLVACARDLGAAAGGSPAGS
jgi:TRAP-type C4-dicarboxylate transport system permease small subunit